jgi:hypothetical protein
VRDASDSSPFQTVVLTDEPTFENSNPTSVSVTLSSYRPYPFQGYSYELKGLKAGTGSLTFRALMPAGAGALLRPTASKTVNYKVRQCDYEISAVHTWEIPLTVVMATMDEVRVTADESGQLSGSGTLEWSYHRRLPGCRVRDTVTPSGVDITGHVSDDGSVSLRFDYQAASVTSTVSCPAICPRAICNQAHQPRLGAVVGLSVPDGGGTVARAHPMGGFSGMAVFTVEPVEDPGLASTDPIFAGARGAADLSRAAGS